MMIALVCALACATGLAGCHNARSRSGSLQAAIPPSAPVTSLPRPLPEDFQRGVNYAHIHSRGHGYGSQISAAQLDTLHRLGVNAIAITPFGFQRGAHAAGMAGFPIDTSRRRGDPSMTTDDLDLEIANAHERGVKVVLKPQLWSNDFWDGGEWHGSVDQDSPAAHASWWNSYRAFALHYAEVAERGHADMYCIGTELVRMTTRYPDEWRTLIGDIRKVYHGKLSYAAHWEHEFDSIPFWDALDYIGITAYFPLNVSDSANVDQLVAAWKPHRERIERLEKRFSRPVLFLEAGYRPATGTYREPWVYEGGSPDAAIQARGYEALFRAFSDAPWWRGVYFWKCFTDPAAAEMHGEDMGFCFRGRPAERVVAAWFGGTCSCVDQ
ncbi:MAG: hypothetical protein JST22_07535 [Bacteroidetes bacterium]|nr:hypothetical protein [Bacteroidota bacterium]